MHVFEGPGQWTCRVETSDFERRFRFGLARRPEAGVPMYALTAASVVATDSEPIPWMLDMHASEGRNIMQAIVDAAWAAGIKPTMVAAETAAPSAANAALRAHLEDMRTIAFIRIDPTGATGNR